MNCGIAIDSEWPLKIISDTLNDLVVCILKIQHMYCTKSITTVGREQLFLLSYAIGKTVIWCWATIAIAKFLLSFVGIDIGLLLTLNVEQFEDIEGYANETGILVWTSVVSC